MTGLNIIANLRTQLAQQVAERPTVPACQPLNVSPWVAMSLLQKAIRRGHVSLALQAAATLHLDSSDRLWRRCGCIAFEDIGVADLNTVGLVTAALGGKRVRAALGGEWVVASMIVTLMAKTKKCRSADDLLMGVELAPDLAQARHAQAILSGNDLRRLVLGPSILPERALALWFVLGTDRRPSPHLAMRKGEPAFVFDLLDELGVPPTAVEIAREGFRRTREVLCPFVAMLSVQVDHIDHTVSDDTLPPEMRIGQVPGWSLDTYTREGRAALARFTVSDAETARWIRDRLPASRRVAFLGDLLFHVEGGLLQQRIHWPLATELRRRNELECRGVPAGEAAEALRLLQVEIPQLNRLRAMSIGTTG